MTTEAVLALRLGVVREYLQLRLRGMTVRESDVLDAIEQALVALGRL